MDSSRLKYFIVVSETSSIRKAAEVLNITPAALSKAIKRLEHETGTTLLAPVGRGILITEEGKKLACLAQPLIENLEKLKVEFKKKKKLAATSVKPIWIGSFEPFTTHFLKNLISALPDNTELLLRELIPGDIEKSLLKHEVDYGITFIPIPTEGISYQQVASFEMKIYGQAKIFDKVSFKKLPFVTPVQPLLKSVCSTKELDGWPDDYPSRLIKYKVDMMESALELCRQGKAVAYLPSFLINLHNKTVKSDYNLQSIAASNGMLAQRHTIFIVKRKSNPNDKIIEKIAAAIHSTCK